MHHHAADQPDQGRARVGPAEVEQQQDAVRRGEHAGDHGRASGAPASRRHLQSADPLGLQDAGAVGRDQPAREAVVERERLRRPARAPAGCAGGRRSCRRRVLTRSPPRTWSDSTSTSLPGGRADQVEQVAHRLRRSRSRRRSSPRRRRSGGTRCVCGIARRSARLSCGSRSPYATVSRYDALVAAATTPRSTAEWLIGTPARPVPERTPSTETLRSKGTVAPAVASTATPGATQVVAQEPAARHDARRRRPWSAGPGRVLSTSVVRRLADDRQLDRDVHEQRADGDPRQGVVGGAEVEVPRVPLRGVGEPGDELEDRRGDEDRDRDPLQAVQDELPGYARGPGRRAWGRRSTA